MNKGLHQQESLLTFFIFRTIAITVAVATTISVTIAIIIIIAGLLSFYAVQHEGKILKLVRSDDLLHHIQYLFSRKPRVENEERYISILHHHKRICDEADRRSIHDHIIEIRPSIIKYLSKVLAQNKFGGIRRG